MLNPNLIVSKLSERRTMNTKLVGSYRIGEELGRGGMGTVYRAWNTALERYEALKIFTPRRKSNTLLVKFFLREAQTAARLYHPHIITIFGVNSAADCPYFTMELIGGGSLADYLRHRGRLELTATLSILKQSAAALDYVHSEGLVHGDIKPANILLTTDGQIKIIDFCTPWRQPNAPLWQLRKGIVWGTPEYMSPEQVRKERFFGAADQYALALIAYEMLSGKKPFASNRYEFDTGLDQSFVSGLSALGLSTEQDMEWSVPSSAGETRLTHIARLQPHSILRIEEIPSLTSRANRALLKALSEHAKNRFPSCLAFIEELAALTRRSSKSSPRSNVIVEIPTTKVKPEVKEKLILEAERDRLARLSGYPVDRLPNTTQAKQAMEVKRKARIASLMEELTQDSFSLAEVRQRTGWSRQIISQHIASKELYALPVNGELYFPQWQFQGQTEIVAGLSKVRRILERNQVALIGQMSWLTKPMISLDETPQIPLEMLRAGQIDQVIQAAQSVQMSQ